MMKSTFYFILNALFVLRFLIFCPDLFGPVGKRLDKKAKVKFKIYDVHILPIISSSKSNQTMKFGQ